MPTISQEELDRLRAGATGTAGPLGAPVGEGLAARSIADYLRGGGGGYGGGRAGSRGGGIQNVPRGGYGGGAPLGGGGLSYGGNTSGSSTPNFHELAAKRGAAREAGATLQQLQNVDAQQREQNRQSENAFGYNDKQTAALENAWASSPDKTALDAENRQRARQGLPAIQSDYGLNRYHTNPDGSRDYNYSADGQYRGAIPDQFRNAPGDANTHDAHFNKETGKWEQGDLSLMQTFKDIGGGLADAYGNIRETIPLMGQEVVTGFKDLYGDLTGKTNERKAAEKAADVARAAATHSGATNSQGRALSTTDTSGNQYTVNPVFNKPAPVAAKRDRESAGTKAQKAANRAQLSARKASAKLGSGGALHGGGRNDGGYIYRNFGGPIAQSNIREEEIQQQQRAANAPQVASSSGGGIGQQIGKKAIGALLGSATGGLGSMLGGLFNDGGKIPQYRNMGGPLANPNGYNEGGATGETPIKKVMDEQKLMQNQKAFDLDQKRKQEAHDAAMKQKAQAFSQGQKMKTESATTKMKPKSPLGG